MALFAVVLTHHDLDLRADQLQPHVDWLDRMVAAGFVALSGPFTDGPLAHVAPVTAMLIVRAADKGEALRVMATDPFYETGVTDSMTITEWNPVFGLLADESTGRAGLR